MASEEKPYFTGYGELVATWTEHKDAAAKVGSLLVMGVAGYLAFGRDRNKSSKVQGMLVVTNRAIYCGNNAYPFDKILSVTSTGLAESLVLTFRGLTVELEIRARDPDALKRGLEQAKTAR